VLEKNKSTVVMLKTISASQNPIIIPLLKSMVSWNNLA